MKLFIHAQTSTVQPAAGAWQMSSFIVAAAHMGSLYADYVLAPDGFMVALCEMVSFHNMGEECMGMKTLLKFCVTFWQTM